MRLVSPSSTERWGRPGMKSLPTSMHLVRVRVRARVRARARANPNPNLRRQRQEVEQREPRHIARRVTHRSEPG